jgi:predicted porin
MAQYQLGPRLYVGVRGDWTQSIDDDRIDRYAVLPYVSYYFSEFLRFRVNYEHLWSDDRAEDGRDTVYLELNFVIGAHPPEPFWVNR